MAKTKISEYSSTANSNTDIASINIDEGCAPSGINNAIRALMAQLKDFQTGAASDPVTVGGVLTVTGGSATAPAITTSGDTNTGVYFPAADTVGITTGGTERVRVDSSGNVGIGSTSLTNTSLRISKGITGSTSSYGVFSGGQIQADVTAAASYFQTSVNTIASAFALTSLNHYIANQSTIGAGSTVTSQYGFQAASTLTGATNNYGFYGNIASGTGRYNFYAAGTADNYFAGNVGIGTSSPAGKVDIASTSTTQPVFRALNNGANWAQMLCGYNGTSTNYYDADTQIFRNGATQTERMRIDSSGNLLVGKTTSGNTVVGFEVNPTGAVFSTIASSTNSNSTSHVYSSTAGAYRFYVGMGGTVYATSTSITAISDESLKENIRGLETGLSEILSLKPRRFDWKENTGIDQKNVAGFIAQEFEKVFPDLVYEYQYNETETKKSIKMGDILPTIVKAIQEQQAIINAQQATLTTLTARIEALENK
jgi:hypothetical protein